MSDIIKVVATDQGLAVTRLVYGVELKLQESGKHWTLSVSKTPKESKK